MALGSGADRRSPQGPFSDDAAHGETEARAVVVPYIRQQLQAGPDLPVYLASSVSQQRLILDIRASLDGSAITATRVQLCRKAASSIFSA